MMIHAYSELYLSDAQILLANAFDYSINDCHLTPERFEIFFLYSKIVREFENGNPGIISGKAGVEIAQDIIRNVDPSFVFPEPSFSVERSPEYWAGWALAYYQWFTAKRFKNIFLRVPIKEVLSMYKIFHEMDLSNFVEEMEKRYNAVILEPKLKSLREARGITQKELAERSGVSLRSIQLYEQKVNDIDKAQTHTLYKLSLILCCSIEDLLESPEIIK